MTSKVSNKKITPAFHNWKCNVRSSTKMLIIFAVLHMLAAPAVILAAIISIYSNNELDDAEVYAIIGIMTTCAAGAMGIFVAVDSFKCLYKRSVVDMRLSLPMTSDQRFVSNFLSGLFVYIAPFLAAQVFSILLALYGLIFMEGKTFYSMRYVDGKSTLVPYTCEYFSEIMPVLLKLILCGILVMLMLYTLTVLVTVCCGSKFESIAYAILINGVIPLTILMVTLSMFNNIFGVSPENNALKIFTFTSPAGGIFAAVAWLDDYSLYDVIQHPAVWAIVFFLVTAAFGALAFFLYRKRRAEQVSKPFVFKLLYYIILTGGMFCLYSAFYMAEVSIIPTIITTAVVYMIFEVVTNRGFKRFWLSGIKYAVTIFSAFIIIFAAQKTDGFGALWRVPSESMVTSVEIYYRGFYSDFAGTGNVVLTDRENIEAVIAAHKNVLEEFREYQEPHRSYYSYYDYKGVSLYQSFSVKYKLAGGGTIERDYGSFVSPKTVGILSSIDLTEEYKTQAAEACKENIKNIKSNYEWTVERQKANNRSDYMEFTAELTSDMSYSWNDSYSGISMYYLCSHDFFEQLAEAYANDIMAINEENYYYSEIPENYTLIFRNSYQLSVPGSFENTLRLLAEYDFYIPKNENISDAELYVKLLGNEVRIFSEDEWRELMGIDEGEILHASYSGQTLLEGGENNEEYKNYVYNYGEDLFDILRHAQPRNIVGENCYTIHIFGSSYVIPAEMQDAAERAASGRSPYNAGLFMQYAEELNELRRTANGASNYYY